MFLGLPALDKLVVIGKLKAEPRNDAEVGRLLAMARTRFFSTDSQVILVTCRHSVANDQSR